jgi:hypothetical protein
MPDESRGTSESLRNGVGEKAATGREAHAIGVLVDQAFRCEAIQRGALLAAKGTAVSVLDPV